MSKQSILNSIRQHKPDFGNKPQTTEPVRRPQCPAYDSPVAAFVDNVIAAGGEVIRCPHGEAAATLKAKFPEALNMTYPAVSGRFSPSTALEALNGVECVAFAGRFGVAENGAVWLEDSDLPHRILPFITQRLALMLDDSQIVPTMHEAYDRISLGATGYGVFISGPSKTADIEQSLVYGAHGAVSLTVILSEEKK